MQKLQRVSVFRRADNEKGYVQAVISSVDADYFFALGFGPSVDRIPELDTEPTARARGRKRNASEGESEE